MEQETKKPETETETNRKKGWDNLDPCRDTETARARGSLGGIKSVESRRRKKDLKEQINILLSMELSKTKARSIIGDTVEDIEDRTYGNLLSIKMLQEAMEGNVRCAEFIRDTSGQKPTQEINLEANVITDQDKALLEKIAKRTEKLE